MRLWFGRKRIPITAPGPSPWYLSAPWASLRTPQGTWLWGFYDGPTLAGLSYLKTPAGAAVLILDFQYYVLSLPKDRILLWRESGRKRESNATPRITFQILHLSELRALPDPQSVADEMRKKKQTIVFEGGNPIAYEFLSNASEGTHAIDPPLPFLELPEVLVLADFGSEDGNHFDKMFRAIFAFDFKARQVSVIPQRWFNEGSYDFGYQWITRVQREEKTGQIVGEGIRLGNFRLDRSATQVQEWLHKDAFYHPEYEL
jgi:hypothetical protein